jgi:carboxylesterase type B
MSAFASTRLPGFYAISTVLTYSYFKCPTYRALTATTKAGVPAWTYLDDHTPGCGCVFGLTSHNILELLVPTHTSEIPFVFAELSNLPLPAGSCSFNEQEIQISKALASAWSVGMGSCMLHWVRCIF